MKGLSSIMKLIIAVVIIAFTFYIMFVYWDKVSELAQKSLPQGLGALTGLVFLKKKGIVLTTNLLVMIVMLVLVALMIFLIFAGIGAEAGPSSNSLFYGFFDAILRSLPWVS